MVIAGGGGAFLHPTHCLGQHPLAFVAGTQGKSYTRAAAYPSARVSRLLSYQIPFKFRSRNWRFDLIGGLAYLALAHPLFTTCASTCNTHFTESTTLIEFVSGVVADTKLAIADVRCFVDFHDDVHRCLADPRRGG
jgi:hypothetical protein